MEYKSSYSEALARKEKSSARKASRINRGLESALLADALIPSKSTAKAPPRRRKVGRKGLVKRADTAFSLKIRELYPVSFFSGKPTECCFHIVSRSKHSVRWSLDNAVGSTMGENYEMEFNPHKYITILIEKRGLPWYESLVRRSNETRKFGRDELEDIADRGHDGFLSEILGGVEIPKGLSVDALLSSPAVSAKEAKP